MFSIGTACSRSVKLSLILFCALALRAQVYSAGPQVLTFFSGIDDSDQPYALYLPKGFDAAKKYPLVISLHGAWSNHRLNLRRVFGKGNRAGESDPEATRYFPVLRDVDFLVASPYSRGTMGYQGIPEQDVYDVLADVKRRFSIDEDRIYLTGLSMGGGGTFWLALTRPDIWAAIAPVCAAVPEGSLDLAPNLLNIPVHLFHGDADPAVPVEQSRKWNHELLRIGANVQYTEYPGVRHNSWDLAYKDGAIFDWFSKFRRNRFPEEVRFATRNYKYNSAYWVQLDGLTPGDLAKISARFKNRNELVVETSGVKGFTLTPAGHSSFAAGRAVSVAIDGAVLKVKGTEKLSFRKAGKGWQPGRYIPAPGEKRPGSEGPIGEAVAARHVYVYGTADSPSPEELNQRRRQAEEAAEWSTPRLKLLVNFRTMADKDVRESDLKGSNLVLFGTRETNSLIARLAGDAPVALNAGAADFGLVFVMPLGEHYALVNSGLPWWTGADRAQRAGFRFMPPPYRLLLSFGDYILFKGSLDNVIVEGRFTPQWTVPPQEAEKMKATAAVTLRAAHREPAK
ncbi:MAG: dienelactone hydrolase family protein [Bryobacteraceae bacterium]|nr:dienelactone hydrolase family protein [Bryobacterales bacterium]NUM99512.1 dienelactone hydrolase family protein [Bryobacteraceae bacterium]